LLSEAEETRLATIIRDGEPPATGEIVDEDPLRQWRGQ
jgi:hypothetical protein